jgi:hypothetical protein
LSNSKTSNKTTAIYSSHATFISNKNRDTENPEDTELTSSPNTPDTIADEESARIEILLDKTVDQSVHKRTMYL